MLYLSPRSAGYITWPTCHIIAQSLVYDHEYSVCIKMLYYQQCCQNFGKVLKPSVMWSSVLKKKKKKFTDYIDT